MLSAKPWKPDAVLRLILSIFICIYAGSLILGIVHFAATDGKPWLKFYPASAVALASLGAALVIIRKPWSPDNFMKRAVWLLGCFYIGLFIGVWTQQMAWPVPPKVPTSGQMLTNLLSFQGAALVLVGLFLREHQTSWAEGFGFGHQQTRAVLFGLVAACLYFGLASNLQGASAQLLDWSSRQLTHLLPHLQPFKPEEQLPIQTLRSTVAWTDRLILGVGVIVVAPCAEELLFRGILYPWLKGAGYPKLALIGSSLAFAAMHLSLTSFVPLFVLALLLVGLYEWTGNLLAPICAHSLFNAFNFVLLYRMENLPLGR
jgi:membrane protease YdiL (CAAX protease family)